MIFHAILFYTFAAVLVGAALGVIFARNPVHAVMFLILSFFQSAVLWLLAEAEFLAIGVAGLMVAELALIIWRYSSDLVTSSGFAATPEGYSNTEALGAVLYTEHVYAFEIAAVILLLAIIAAISLTMRRRPGLKQQNVAKQVAVRVKDRVRIVKMAAEKPAGEGES